MSSSSFLARLGLRSALLGSAAHLAYAAPMAAGSLDPAAHTHSGRTGWFHPTTTSMGFVANGVERVRLWDNGGVQIGGDYESDPGAGCLALRSAVDAGYRLFVQNPDDSYVFSIADESAVPAALGLGGNSLNLGVISIRSDGIDAGFNFSSLTAGADVLFNNAALGGSYRFRTSPLVAGTLVDRMIIEGNAPVRVLTGLSTAFNSYSASQTLTGDNSTVVYSGTGGHTFTMPLANVAAGLAISIKHAGSGTLTLARQSSNVFDGSATSVTLNPGDSITLTSNGVSSWVSTNRGGVTSAVTSSVTGELVTFADASGRTLAGSGIVVDTALVGGTALNLAAFESDPVSPLEGDIWILDDGTSRYLKFRGASATYAVELT
jgi:hypothetical protein